MTRFRDLALGQSFDWVDPAPDARSSFFHRCVRTSARCYRSHQGDKVFFHKVGSIDAKVFNVGDPPNPPIPPYDPARRRNVME